MNLRIANFDLARYAQQKGCQVTVKIDEDLSPFGDPADVCLIYTDDGHLIQMLNYSPMFDLKDPFHDIIAPTLSQLQEWLMDEKNIYVTVEYKQGLSPRYHIITWDDELVGQPGDDYWEVFAEGIRIGLECLIDA